MENGLTHFDKEGNAVMVDVSGKNVTYRTALATGYIAVGPEIMACVTKGNVKKGDVLGVARVAGIMGVKKTSELIPMCHPLPIQKCAIDYELDQEKNHARESPTPTHHGAIPPLSRLTSAHICRYSTPYDKNLTSMNRHPP